MFQTSIKSLTIEPENLLGSIGVGAESARVLSASLVKNPGMLRSLDLKGLKTWNDDDLSSIFRSIRNSGRGVLNRLVLCNTTLGRPTGGDAVEQLHRLLKSDNGFLETLALDDSDITYLDARRVAQGFWRTKTLKSLSLLNCKVSTDGAAILLDSMTQSNLETMVLRNNGLRLVENFKYVESLPVIDAKLIKELERVGNMNRERRTWKEASAEL